MNDKIPMRRNGRCPMWPLVATIMLLTSSLAYSQEDPFAVADAKSDDISEHPYGETPLGRMVTLSHTSELPKCDRVIVYALANSKPMPQGEAFPIRPYKRNVQVLEMTTLVGRDVKQLSDAWRNLKFDKFAGAFCHFPVYGLRFYRSDKLLFETSVCWKCSNFYLPDVEPEESDFDEDTSYQWYGFKYDAKAAKLLATIRQHLEHPALKEKQ